MIRKLLQAISLILICAMLVGFTISSLTVSTINGVSVTSDSFTQVKCANIDPTNASTSWFFWRTPAAITVTHVNCIVDASTSVVMTLQECDANGANCAATEAAMTCATTNTAESGGIDDAAVASGVWMKVLRGTVTGGAVQATLCVTYTTP